MLSHRLFRNAVSRPKLALAGAVLALALAVPVGQPRVALAQEPDAEASAEQVRVLIQSLPAEQRINVMAALDALPPGLLEPVLLVLSRLPLDMSPLLLESTLSDLGILVPPATVFEGDTGEPFEVLED